MDDYSIVEELLEKTQEIDLDLCDYDLKEDTDESILLEDTIELDLSSVVEEDVYYE